MAERAAGGASATAFFSRLKAETSGHFGLYLPRSSLIRRTAHANTAAMGLRVHA
jgi:hypothetical protein